LDEKGTLPSIATPIGREVARTMKEILEEAEFDRLNHELQHELFGGDYVRAPYPIVTSEVGYSTIREALESSVRGFDPRMTVRKKHAFEFFMFTESLRKQELEVLFGKERSHRIDGFLNAGLLVETNDGRFRMNGLSLLSRRLGRERNGEVIYILADSPFYDDPEQDRLEKVYIGLDSYELLNKLPELGELSGTGVDMGSGSGIQLIAALKLFPDVRKMVGYEKERRAINVSKFNACLNGVEDKVTIVENDKELEAALRGNGGQADFAVSNPPFMPVPESIEIDPGDLETLSKAKALSINGEKSAARISLKNMWPMTGWGGEDGISVLKPMLGALFPLMKPSGTIAVYGEFAGKAAGPTKIVEFIESQAGWEYSWEPLKPSTYGSGRWAHAVWPLLSAQSMAIDVMQHIIGGYPELAHPSYRDILMRYTEKILRAYQRLEITHFHKGFLNLRKGKNSAEHAGRTHRAQESVVK